MRVSAVLLTLAAAAGILVLAGLAGLARAQSDALGGANLALYNEGLEAFHRQDYDSAYLIWKPLAESGNPVAQYSLGKLFDQGGGVIRPNSFLAALWYRRAAGQGVTAAQNNLAILYAKGRGVPQNEEQAAELWQQAAEGGHALAKFNLALSYYNGRGLEKDPQMAVRWFKAAATSGIAEAQFVLGQFYQQGLVLRQDLDQATIWYRMAAQQGHPRAWAEVRQLSETKQAQSGEAATAAGASHVAKGASGTDQDETTVDQQLAAFGVEEDPVDAPSRTAPPSAKASAPVQAPPEDPANQPVDKLAMHKVEGGVDTAGAAPWMGAAEKEAVGAASNVSARNVSASNVSASGGIAAFSESHQENAGAASAERKGAPNDPETPSSRGLSPQQALLENAVVDEPLEAAESPTQVAMAGKRFIMLSEETKKLVSGSATKTTAVSTAAVETPALPPARPEKVSPEPKQAAAGQSEAAAMTSEATVTAGGAKATQLAASRPISLLPAQVQVRPMASGTTSVTASLTKAPVETRSLDQTARGQKAAGSDQDSSDRPAAEQSAALVETGIETGAGAWRVWLASERSPDKADAFLIEAVDSFPDLFDRVGIELVEADMGTSGHFYRIMSGSVETAEDAGAVCERIWQDQPDAFCQVQKLN